MPVSAPSTTRRGRGRRVTVNATQCKYDVVFSNAKERQWKIVTNEDDHAALAKCNLHWIDVAEIYDAFKRVQPYQVINHFPGMSNIARKSRLAKNIDRMRKSYPQEYDFCPRTWILPLEFSDFEQQFNQFGHSGKTFIIKPDAGCQGRGVFLTRQLEKVSRTECQVAQRYIRHPLLIAGKKFDLRVYILMTSCSPLRVYLFKDGLVRLCTSDYVAPSASNLDQRYMHLTNYSINRLSEDYVADDGDSDDDGESGANKRTITWFMKWIAEERSPEEAEKLWDRVGDVCLKTIIAIQPTLEQEYASTFAKFRSFTSGGDAGANNEPNSPVRNSCCFEILGFDILVDVNLKPWLIEVNHLPSFKCDSKLDRDIKQPLVSQALDLLKISAKDEQRYEEMRSLDSQQRLYGRDGKRNSTTQGDDNNQTRTMVVTTDKRPGSGDKESSVSSALPESELRELLTKFYEEVCPDREVDMDRVISKYLDHQEELESNLKIKYGRGLQRFVPETPSSTTDEAAASEPQVDEENLIDYVRIYPPADKKLEAAYDQMIQKSKKHLDDLQMRLQAPLQQKRGGGMNKSLPPIKGVKRSEMGRDCFGHFGTDRMQEASSQPKKPLSMPGPAQAAAALRLMHGRSSVSSGSPVATPPPANQHEPKKPSAISYGLAYRERLQGIRHKPTVAMTQVTLGSCEFIPSPRNGF